MESLIERLFDGESAFEARFVLAKRHPSDEKSPRPTEEFRHFDAIAHDGVLSFLAPHEILSLLRTSRGAWDSAAAAVGGTLPSLILRSVFSYLRISREAAENVSRTVEGGWRSFAPRLVGMCEHLAAVYGHFEPDLAHRTFLAEQLCFADRSWPYFGSLACYEKYMEEDGEVPPVEGVVPQPVMSLDRLKQGNSRKVCWGNPELCLGVCEEGMTDWLARHKRWMQEHASDCPNEHYRLRLEKGLHPAIWIFYDNDSEPVEWALGIGQNREQFVSSVSSYNDLTTWENAREKQTETFWSCLSRTDDEIGNGGMVKFLLGMPCAVEEMHEFQPTIGIAIWCMRHGIEPLTDESIDWTSMIDEEHEDDEESSDFLKEALHSPLYGPADFRDFVWPQQKDDPPAKQKRMQSESD